MNQQKPVKNAGTRPIQVRTGVTAGASVESCLNDLYYWQNEYYKNCGGPKPTPYTS